MVEKIRVLSIITGLNTGGAEMMLYKTMKNIDRTKYEPIVVSLLPDGVVAKYIREENIPVYSLDFKGIKGILKSLSNLMKIIKEKRPIIIHAYMFHADILARILGKVTKTPIIISSIRNENIGGRIREFIMRLTDSLTDCVTVVCKQAASTLIEAKIIKERKTRVIYNGVELNKFNQSNNQNNSNNNDKFNILSVGRLHKQKNYPLLIRAISELVDIYPNINVSIAGEGNDRGEIEALIRRYDLEKNIFLLGRRTDITHLLNESDLFVLPSSWEGMPNVILEAMAASKPVVATRVGGTPEIIQDNITGLLISPNNKNELVNSIQKMIRMDKKDREKMGIVGRRRVESNFSIKKTIEETEELYDFLLKTYKRNIT